MDLDGTVRELHPLETMVLRHFDQGEAITASRLQSELDLSLGQCNQAFSWLTAKELLEVRQRRVALEFELTELGRRYQKEGTPEECILELVAGGATLTMPEIAKELSLSNQEVGSAYGRLSKEGLLGMDGEKRVVSIDGPAEVSESSQRGPAEAPTKSRIELLRGLLNRLSGGEAIAESQLDESHRSLAADVGRKRGASRGMVKIAEREALTYALSERGSVVRRALIEAGVTGEEVGVLTSELLRTGEWRERGFRPYRVETPPVRVLPGRKNPYMDFVEQLKDKLISLGFEEFDGPLLETEFWNSDALFMPQFHSARDIHDVFRIKDPSHANEIEQPYLDRVAAAHENGAGTGSRGWRYRFDKNFTRRMVLRSQGTVLSAKTLGHAKVPGKYFGSVRCFRYDTVDATHAAEFYQTEGIVLGEDVNLRTLLGLLKVFAEEVAGAKEMKFMPDYFPFTEPSVEVHIKHPEIGWMELGGSGIFRPEVTAPMGVEVPVLAWGLGIDRMAMTSMGINDLRDLFTPDIDRVRLRVRK
jgi:phenylalanyl-tRNA synthetase alpha chain